MSLAHGFAWITCWFNLFVGPIGYIKVDYAYKTVIFNSKIMNVSYVTRDILAFLKYFLLEPQSTVINFLSLIWPKAFHH